MSFEARETAPQKIGSATAGGIPFVRSPEVGRVIRSDAPARDSMEQRNTSPSMGRRIVMALAAVVASLAGLAADVAKEYTPVADGPLKGQYMLGVNPVSGFGLENATELRSALEGERGQVTTLKQNLKSFEGLDASKAREALDKVEKMKTWTPEDKVKEQIAAQVGQVETKYKADLDKVDGVSKRRWSQIEKLTVRAEAAGACAKHKGSPDLLMPHILAQTRVRENDDGSLAIEVLQADGKTVRISGKPGATTPMTVDELVETMKSNDVFGRAFEGTGARGGGASGGGGSGGQQGSTYVISAADARDVSKYQAAKKAAVEKGLTLIVGD